MQYSFLSMFFNSNVSSVGWTQESRECIFVILSVKVILCSDFLCTSLPFWHLVSSIYMIYVNTLKGDLQDGLKCVILPVLSICWMLNFTQNVTFLHSHDELFPYKEICRYHVILKLSSFNNISGFYPFHFLEILKSMSNTVGAIIFNNDF